MYTKNTKGPIVTHFHGVTEEEETKWIIRKIKNLVESGAKLHDFAILYRANFLSRAVEQAFINESLDYVVFSGVNFRVTIPPGVYFQGNAVAGFPRTVCSVDGNLC